MDTHDNTPNNPDVDGTEVISEPVAKPNIFQRFGHWYLHKKLISIPLTILLLLIATYAVPPARYFAAGWFINRQVTVQLTDQQSGKPISAVLVTVDGKQGKTDQTGKLTIGGVTAGYHTVTFSKKYYRGSQQNIEVLLYNDSFINTTLVATGRQVSVKVVNAINGQALSDGTITLDKDTSAITDKTGIANLVVPASYQAPKVTVAVKTYNDASFDLTITDDSSKNLFKLIPSGSLYFLSKASGKIDVVKTNLDGSGRKTILGGTGLEDDRSTSLLASRDWKYVTLSAKRNLNKPAGLYLINGNDDTVIPLDESNADITPVGWSNDSFVYSRTDKDILPWQPKRSALKAYNTSTKKTIVIDEALASGDNDANATYETYGAAYILENEIITSKVWHLPQTQGPDPATQRSTLLSLSVTGQNSKVIKSAPASEVSFIDSRSISPQEIYFSLQDIRGAQAYYEYRAGNLTNIDATKGNDEFYKNYPTYLISPSGAVAFWADQRDGKSTLITGDKNGDSPKEILQASDFKAYGWYSDAYLLVSKGGSELYIMPSTGPAVGVSPLKVSDYHKPSANFNGYGYGYGGQ